MSSNWAKVRRATSKIRAFAFWSVTALMALCLLLAAWDAALGRQASVRQVHINSGDRVWALSWGFGNACVLYYHVRSKGVTVAEVASFLVSVGTGERKAGWANFGTELVYFPDFPYAGRTAFKFTNTDHPDFYHPRHLLDIAFPPGVALRFEDQVESEFQLHAGSSVRYYPARRFVSFMAPDWFLAIILGLLAWPLGLPYWHAVARRRRIARGLCACGYDLRAHKPGDKCPECGAVVSAKLDRESPVVS